MRTNEQSVITEWIQKHGRSPLTRQSLSIETLVPSLATNTTSNYIKRTVAHIVANMTISEQDENAQSRLNWSFVATALQCQLPFYLILVLCQFERAKKRSEMAL